MKKVIVPRAPGQFSAWGMLMTNLRHDFIRTHVMPCAEEKIEEIAQVFSALQGDAERQFQEEGFPLEKVWIERFLDLRYKGQEHTVRTPVPEGALEQRNLELVIAKFHELHERAYSFRLDDPVEIVNFHVVGWGEVEKPELKPLERAGHDMDRAFKGERQVYFEELGMVPSKIYERDLIPPGEPISGPAIIEEPACTTIVCPDQQVVVDERGYLIITEVAR